MRLQDCGVDAVHDLAKLLLTLEPLRQIPLPLRASHRLVAAIPENIVVPTVLHQLIHVVKLLYLDILREELLEPISEETRPLPRLRRMSTPLALPGPHTGTHTVLLHRAAALAAALGELALSEAATEALVGAV